MKNVFKTIGVTLLLLFVYMALQTVLSVIPMLVVLVNGMDGAVDAEKMSEMMVAGFDMTMPGAINALAWGLFLSTIAMLLFLHFTGFYKLKRSLLNSVPRRPLILSVLLVFAAMFSLNILVQCFSLENLLEEQFKELSHNVIGVITIAFLAPLLEEVLFRGAIQGYMMRYFKPWVAIVCSALIFGLIHMNPVQIVYATLLGVILGWIYYRTGSLLPVILGHVLNNSVATITTLLAPEHGADAPMTIEEKTAMAVVFVFATVVAVKLVQMLNRSMPKVSADDECAVAESDSAE